MPFNNAKNFVINANKIDMFDNNNTEDMENMEKRRGAFRSLYKRACHGAGHKTEERFDPPKCHEETRLAVINDIISWANDTNFDKRIMWMSGPAGAGKSAIAQTVAETCEDDILVSSFFFSRTATATGRDDGFRLIPSLAYQMAIRIPETKPFVVKAIQDDHAVLNYSMDKIMQKLIVEPLKAAISENRTSRTTPELVIIDGLDECHDPKIQVSIINTIARAVCSLHVPLRFLIVSRPELEIRKEFGSQFLDPICHKLVLDEKYKPEKDIEIYMRSEFNIIKRGHSSLFGDTSWPSDDDIDALVRKSSGQFIYASTVMKYINNDRKNPRKLLQVIRNIIPSVDNPYAEIDALYTHILSNCQQDYSLVKRLFEALLSENMLCNRLSIDGGPMIHSLSDYGDFICVEDIDLVVSDLHSILHVGEREPRLYHASFSDFLNDISRSRRFYICGDDPDATFIQLCLARIQKGHQEKIPTIPLLYACSSYFLLVLGEPSTSRDQTFSSVARLLNETPRETVETAVRYLVLNPFWFFLQPVLERCVVKRRRTCREFGQLPLHPSYSLSMKVFTIRLIPRPHRIYGVSPRKVSKNMFKHIQDAANKYALHYFRRNNDQPDRSRTYLRVIYDGVLCSSHPEDFTLRLSRPRADIMWLGDMLECPLHGKEYFLSSENSEKFFRIIWEERWSTRNHIFKGDVSRSPVHKIYPEEYVALPATLHYLLRRCNISPTFRNYLRTIFPDLQDYLSDILKNLDEILGTSESSNDSSLIGGTIDRPGFRAAGSDGLRLNSTVKSEYERDRSFLISYLTQFNFGSLPKTTAPQYGKYCHCSFNQWRMSWIEKWWQTWDMKFHPLRRSQNSV